VDLACGSGFTRQQALKQSTTLHQRTNMVQQDVFLPLMGAFFSHQP
jgi:hypothetical protein